MDRALLVGINRYPGAPLAGCVNDVSDMADCLVSRYRFSDRDIRILVDERATTKNIKGSLEWLVDDLKIGDRCVFHFSGHGVQVATRNRRQEVDGLDEVLCPVDFNWADKYLIRDKYLYNVFRKMPPGVKFAWVNDSCHSGDLTRSMPQILQAPKTIDPPIDVLWDVQIAKGQKMCCIEMSPCNHILDVHSRSITKGILDVGFVSGCRSDQISADIRVNSRACGALTHFFLKNLKAMPKKTPLHKIVEATSAELARNKYSQRPQAEGGRKGKPFLG